MIPDMCPLLVAIVIIEPLKSLHLYNSEWPSGYYFTLNTRNIIIGIIFLPKLRGVLLSPSRNGGVKVTLTTCMKLKLERVSVLFNSVLPRILLRHAEQFTKLAPNFSHKLSFSCDVTFTTVQS